MFAAMPNVKQLGALPAAWHWSLAPGFDFAAALSRDGKHMFQCYALDSYDEDLAVTIMSFARKHESELVAPPERPLVVVEGFSHLAYKFDTMVAISPIVHRYHEENPDVREATRAVFPAYRCEFSGHETEEQTWYRYSRAAGVQPAKLTREPHPYVRMRERTESGRVIAKRGFAQPKTLVLELPRLENRPDRFVEFENYRQEVWRVEWDGSWVLTGESVEPRRLTIDRLLAFVQASLYGPNLNAATSRLV
jgi:hypothetical protein